MEAKILEDIFKCRKELNMIDKLKKYSPLIIIFIVLGVSNMPYIINNDSLLIFYGDSYEQQLHFYMHGYEMIKSGEFAFWDWSLGFGANTFSHVFYFLFSPFFYLTLLFEKSSIPYLFLYLNALKMLLMFMFTYLWLGEVVDRKESRIMGAFLITFSGWVMSSYHTNHLLDMYSLYPLVLFFTEKFLKERKFRGLVITSALIGIFNYYFLYMLIPFLCIYALFRYIILNNDFTLKIILNDGIKYFLYLILGVLLSSIVLIPSVNILMQVPRLSDGSSGSIFEIVTKFDIYRIFSSLFIPVMERFEPNYYISNNTYEYIGWGAGNSLYTFIITPAMIIVLPFLKDKKQKHGIGIIYLILFIFALFPFFYKLFQGTLDTRWYYMFTFMNAYTVSIITDNILDNKIDKKWFSIASIITIIICFLLYAVSLKMWFNPNLDKMNIVKKQIFILALFLSLYNIAFYYRKYTNILLITILGIEAIFCFNLIFKFDRPIKSENFKENTINDMEPINYITDNDDSFYRITYDSMNLITQNEPMAKGYAGVSFYESLYNFEQEDFLARYKSTWSMPATYGRFKSYNLLSTKYWYSNQFNKPSPYGYEFLAQVGDYNIYENKYYIELGYAMDNTLNEDVFKELSIFDQDRVMQNYIITKNSTNTSFEYLDNIEQIGKWVDPIYFEQEFPEHLYDAFIYVETFEMPVTAISQFKYSDMLSQNRYWQLHYVGEYVDYNKAISRFVVEVDNVYDSPAKMNIYIDYPLNYYNEWYNSITTESFYDTLMKPDYVYGKIDIKNNSKMVFTSVPYDKGWTVYVDGEKHDFEKVNLGFIGFDLDEGIHEVEMKYSAPYFNTGMIVSLLSLLLFIFLCRKDKMVV